MLNIHGITKISVCIMLVLFYTWNIWSGLWRAISEALASDNPHLFKNSSAEFSRLPVENNMKDIMDLQSNRLILLLQIVCLLFISFNFTLPISHLLIITSTLTLKNKTSFHISKSWKYKNLKKKIRTVIPFFIQRGQNGNKNNYVARRESVVKIHNTM